MCTTDVPFVPLHCPRSDCAYHRSRPGWRWSHFGYYTRQCSPQRIQRFRCDHCKRTFSTQTFSTTYWLQRPDLQLKLANGTLCCSGYRQLARAHDCAPGTVKTQVSRIGRHALLLLEQNRPTAPVAEAVVIDGFESFAYSQFHPLYLNLVLGADSHYAYAFTHSPLRRKGRMTKKQRDRREELEAEDGRPDPKAIESGTRLALELAVRVPQPLTVRSDEHKAYPRALSRMTGYAIRQEVTSSRAARTPANPLFPVNRMDLWIRQNGANHKRETIAFSKRHQAVVERATWLLVWLNLVKPFSENHGGGTPAMRLGLRERGLTVAELFEKRLFLQHVGLPDEYRRYYFADVRMARIPNEHHHRLKLAV